MRSQAAFLLFLLFLLLLSFQAEAFLAGKGGRSILPPVNGSLSYFKGPVDDSDLDSAGTFVLEWDFGKIAVGNGNTESHWVRDDIRVHVAAIQDESPEKTVAIFISVEVYMIFEPDFEEYYGLVKEAVGEETFSRLRFWPHGQHNHEGPDTSGLSGNLNRQFQEYMYLQMRDATLEALNDLRPAKVAFGQLKHWFGLEDTRDPLIVDETVRFLRVLPIWGDGSVGKAPIATIVQWAMHPEVTLGYRAKVNPGDCERLGRDPTCDARGEFFTADYPGALYRVLQTLDGSEEVVYFNGAIGVQVGPGGQVWEITPEHPIGDGITPPPGAQPLPYNFRKAFLIGQQLAVAIASHQDTTFVKDSEAFEYRTGSQYSRITNPFFKVGLCPRSALLGNPRHPILIGYNMRDLYVCDEGAAGPVNCVSDNNRWTYTPFPVRKGNYGRLSTRYLRLGPVRFISIPGELAPEVSVGVPRDFDDPEASLKYYNRPDLHPIGENYTFPGTIQEMLQCDPSQPCFICGLTADQFGYLFPISDWRIYCVDQNSREQCEKAHALGAMAYIDSMSGESCEEIAKDYDAALVEYTERYGSEIAEVVIKTCKTGQLSYDDGEHYEESNSGGWNGVKDYLNAVSEMLGVPVTGRYRRD